jgi:hypothetical protein
VEQPIKSVSHLMRVARVAAIAVAIAPPAFAQSNVERSTAPLGKIPTLTLPVPPEVAVPNVPSSGASPTNILPTPTPNRPNTLGDCLADWDAATHMSKAEWRRTCQRTVNGTDLPDTVYGYRARQKKRR